MKSMAMTLFLARLVPAREKAWLSAALCPFTAGTKSLLSRLKYIKKSAMINRHLSWRDLSSTGSVIKYLSLPQIHSGRSSDIGCDFLCNPVKKVYLSYMSLVNFHASSLMLSKAL